MEPLKELFNTAFHEHLALELTKVYKNFKQQQFITEVSKNLEQQSLNERMRNASLVLNKYLPEDYKKTIDILQQVIPNMKRGYTSLLFPDYVGQYGKKDIHLSLEALKYFTQFGSSEFAIREFLKHDFNKTIQVMYTWAKDKNYHVRRLASEGSRPRLPWSFKLDEVIKNPKLTQPILETLKADEELYVRKSVANHLNDISKDHPDYMVQVVKGWDKKHTHTAWIVKHASRALIKKGHSASLAVFDFEKKPRLSIGQFKLNTKNLKLGQALQFEFDVVSEKSSPQKLVIDYIIHYRKKAGELSPKVFKLTELELLPKQSVHISKKQVFKDFTTRKHFSGQHLIEIQVNGKVMAEDKFKLEV